MGFPLLTSMIWTILTISYNSDADIDISFSSSDDDDNNDDGDNKENVDEYGDYWDDLIDEQICVAHLDRNYAIHVD